MFVRKTIVAVIVMMLISISPAVWAATYYVSPKGDDSSDGTSPEKAFATIQKGIDTAGKGDIVELKEGVYTESIVFGDKRVTVRSTDYRNWNVVEATIISGGGSGDVVTFSNPKNRRSRLMGVTITKGNRGIYCSGISPTIENCIIRDNADKKSRGGGMYITDGAHPKVKNCVFSGNVAKEGGAIRIEDKGSSPDITGCIFIDNTAARMGGALGNDNRAGPEIVSCVFTRNTAEEGGAIGVSDESRVELVNCTIFANEAKKDGGAIAIEDDSNIEVINSIIWGNTAKGGSSQIDHDSSSKVDVSYSDVEGGWTGQGNINADPLFFDPKDPDGADDMFLTDDDGFYLCRNKGKSPCIDTVGSGAPSKDILGVKRFDVKGIENKGKGRRKRNFADMGAYEAVKALQKKPSTRRKGAKVR